jgi:hypothetical protein
LAARHSDEVAPQLRWSGGSVEGASAEDGSWPF